MSYCDHCEGQRFDRARVLRTLRRIRKELGTCGEADDALARALLEVKALEIPHLDWEEPDDVVVH